MRMDARPPARLAQELDVAVRAVDTDALAVADEQAWLDARRPHRLRLDRRQSGNPELVPLEAIAAAHLFLRHRIGAGGARELIELCYERGWTDGLPVVPPIQEFVDEFLAYTRQLSTPTLYNAIRQARRLGKIARFGFPASAWRHFERQSDTCLICYASSQNQGMPGHLVRSVYSDGLGLPILASGTYRIDHTSPLEKRWGGWYVTGTSGKQTHLGNLLVRGQQRPEDIDNRAGVNVTDWLPGL